MHKWSVQELIDFETKIAGLFNAGKIRAPIHLYSGNESQLLELFESVKVEDWVFTSWRSHYQCLLKGVPANEVEEAIIDGRSIALCFPEYRVFSSAIVAGHIPIAVGTALAIQRSGLSEKVYCFLGDMTSETGVFQTASRYALQHDLPITFIVEDNGKSVLTDTRQVWNSKTLRYEEQQLPNIISYKYENIYPHAGAGKRVQF